MSTDLGCLGPIRLILGQTRSFAEMGFIVNGSVPFSPIKSPFHWVATHIYLFHSCHFGAKKTVKSCLFTFSWYGCGLAFLPYSYLISPLPIDWCIWGYVLHFFLVLIREMNFIVIWITLFVSVIVNLIVVVLRHVKKLKWNSQPSTVFGFCCACFIVWSNGRKLIEYV